MDSSFLIFPCKYEYEVTLEYFVSQYYLLQYRLHLELHLTGLPLISSFILNLHSVLLSLWLLSRWFRSFKLE